MVDAVVVTMDSREMVLQCLAHLGDADQVTVVDNASADGTAEAIVREHPEARVIRLDRPESLAAAYNRGAEAGTRDLVLFLNDDVLVEPESIGRLVEVLNKDSDAVAAAGRLVDADTGATQREYLPRPFPGVGRFVAAFVGLERAWSNNPWTAPHRDRPLDAAPVTVDQPAGACLLVRRSAFAAVGGWDAAFELWFEDTDFARRLGRLGSVVFVPSAAVRHIGGHSTQRLPRPEIVRRSYGSALRYGAKHFGRTRRLLLGALFAAAAGSRSLVTRDRELAGVYRGVFRAALRLLRT